MSRVVDSDMFKHKTSILESNLWVKYNIFAKIVLTCNMTIWNLCFSLNYLARYFYFALVKNTDVSNKTNIMEVLMSLGWDGKTDLRQ